MTRGQFASQVMKQRGIPKTKHTRRAFAAWMQSEGGFARNNPLNTTLDLPGATDYNSVHVKNYLSSDQGIEATCKTFDSHGQGYDRIERAMKRNDSARKILRIIGETNWGTGGSLMREVVEWIARVPGVLRLLERKEIAS